MRFDTGHEMNHNCYQVHLLIEVSSEGINDFEE